ncbi:uncharacterized protein LOC144167840 [Haemaphysalis longicornis]
MGKCFVRNCNSGYKSCKEKFSLFKPPADAEKLAAWRRAISRKDRVLTRKDLVCERHFASHFVVKTWSAEYNGHILMQALATKMATKSPMERRGMLVLDEIQVRKELVVNSKTMTYSSKKEFHINGKCVRWSCYDALYVADTKHAGDERVCPKITYNHVNPSNMLKMRVKLATQIFSESVAKGLQFYAKRGAPRFQVIEDALQWLDAWEEEVVSGKIHKDFFLTPSTAEGLKVTLKSVVQLSNYLLTECGFDYILTAKLNQDRLECFFGTIRQAGGQNEHPTFPTFLQLYRMLSLYTLLKPPKFGNCTVNAEEKRPCITLGDMRLAFQQGEQQTNRLDSLRERLDGLVEEGSWECEDILEHDYRMADTVDCIIYYVTGYLCRKIGSMRNLKMAHSPAEMQPHF